MRAAAHINHVWGIVLAGGEGKRLQGFIQSKYLDPRPKQYTAIVGKRSMLRHTLDRVEHIIPTKYLQIVVAEGHKKYLRKILKEKEIKSVLFVPEDRESAVSIYLALSHIECRDPQAVVAIFPSDHFITEEERFMDYVEKAASFIQQHSDYAVLLGIKPDELNTQYGWIEPSKKFQLFEENRFHKVLQFREKPSPDEARQLFHQGCLWNSMVVVSRGDTLVKMYRQHLKCVYDAFKKVTKSYGTYVETQVTEDMFDVLPSKNFSKCILELISENLYVMRVEGVHWSDWGSEDQIMKDLNFLGVSLPLSVTNSNS